MPGVLEGEPRLMVLNRFDEAALARALLVEGGLVLLQDGVLFGHRHHWNEALGQRAVFALRRDVERRGLSEKLHPGVSVVGLEELVDLLFEAKRVLNV